MQPLSLWNRLTRLPFGDQLFSKLLARKIPYSGSIGATVRSLEAGHCLIEMRDRGALRNHLGSVHAIALANLGELTSGLAQLSVLSDSLRGIVTEFRMEYLKKARGTLIAESRCDVPAALTERKTFVATADIRDASGEVVARAHVTWLIGPKSEKAK